MGKVIPWTAAEDAELKRLHAQGLPLNQIHKKMQRSKSTVHAHSVKLGLSYDRTAMEAAIQASVFDAKASRRRIIEKMYERSEYLIDRLDAPRNGGTFTTLVPDGPGSQTATDLQFVPPADERNTANSIASYLARAEALEKIDADGGMTEARGMVGSILDAIRVSVTGVPRMNPTADRKE